MKTVYFWSPCLDKVGTYWSTINSAVAISKFSKKKFKVKIVNSCGEWDDQKIFFEENNIEVINLGFRYFNYLPKIGYWGSRISYILIYLISFFSLIKLLKKEKPEFFIAHLVTSLPLTIFNIINIKTKCILRISGYPKLNNLRKFLWKISSKKLFKISCPTKDLKKQLLETSLFPEDKLFFLPDPIIRIRKFIDDLNSYENKRNFKEKRSYFIAAGRLTKQKNFDYLINEFNTFSQKNKHIDLYIFGEGEEKQNLDKKIKQKKLSDRIFLKGYTNNIYAHMKNAEAFILSSLWEDPGFVIIEAAFCNLFIISSNCKNGPKEFLLNGRAGILFENNLKNALSNSLDKYLNMEKDIKKMKILAKKESINYTLFRHFKVLNSILLVN